MKSSRLEKYWKKLKKNIIKDIRNLFRLKKEKEAIKNRVMRDTRNFFEPEEEENYYKPVRVVIFGIKMVLNMKVAVIEIKRCRLKNI